MPPPPHNNTQHPQQHTKIEKKNGRVRKKKKREISEVRRNGLGEEEGVVAKSFFRGVAGIRVTDTRATTDKNDPFLNMWFKHGKQWVDKNGAKCNMGFGRITKNTPNSGQKKTEKHLPAFFLHVSFISHLLAFVALVVPNFCFMLALVCFSFFPIFSPPPSAGPSPDRPSAGPPLHRSAPPPDSPKFRAFFSHSGASHETENSKRAHFRAPALQTPTKFRERTPTREKKERKKIVAGEGKKAQHFGPPPFGAPFFLGLGSHPSGPHPSFGAPPSVGLIRIGLSRARPLLSAPTLLPHTGCPPVDPHVFRQAEMVVLKWVLVECGGKICLHKRKDWLTHQCDFPGLAEKETSLCEVVFG